MELNRGSLDHLFEDVQSSVTEPETKMPNKVTPSQKGCICQPIINVTVNPVINNRTETTIRKNSPLKELGSILTGFMQ